MHKLLRRQLRKYLAEESKQKELAKFLSAVNAAYEQTDHDRILLERSLDLTSKELSERNKLLRDKLSLLSETHRDLENSIATLQATFDSTREGIFTLDFDSFEVQSNRLGKEILGIKEDQNEASQNTKQTRKYLSRLKKHLSNPSQLKQLLEKEKQNFEQAIFHTLTFKNGNYYEVFSAPRLLKTLPIGRVWCFRDVTDYRNSQVKIQHQAYHDSLTNLPNRQLLVERLKHAISTAKRESHLVAIMFVDLDHFKKVNDTAGHHVGDKLLVEVSERIKHCIREQDTLARVGGDEFVVLLEGIESTSVVTRISNRIIQSTSTVFNIDNQEFFVGCSIGISIYPRDAEDSAELLKKADISMYHAKDSGRQNFQYFDDSLERIALHQLKIENQLRTAIQNQELEVYYQPKINLSNDNINSAEALIRWFSDGNTISPAVFIPIAESSGLIHDISRFVFEQVCRQVKQWSKDFTNPPTIAVNISPLNFNDAQFLPFITETLNQYGIDGKLIELEITESLLLQANSSSKSFFSALKSLEINLSIDDFGTGYSSLSYLHQLPIDQLKIDKSFILKLSENEANQTLTRTILALAKSLDIEVVAEGVETKEACEWLKRHDCDFAQGFYFHKPMPASAISKIFLKYN